MVYDSLIRLPEFPFATEPGPLNINYFSYGPTLAYDVTFEIRHPSEQQLKEMLAFLKFQLGDGTVVGTPWHYCLSITHNTEYRYDDEGHPMTYDGRFLITHISEWV